MSSIGHDGLHGHTPAEEPSDVEMNDFDKIAKRKRKPSHEDEGVRQQNKRTPLEDPLEGPSGISAPGSTRKTAPSTRPNTVVIIMKSLEQKPIFTKPTETTRLLHESAFGKYILEDTFSVLGKGYGCRFEIPDINKLGCALSEVEHLGQHKIKCWVPKSADPEARMITCRKVGPVDIDEDMEALQREMRRLGGEDKTSILNVTRLQSRHSTPEDWTSIPTMTLKIEFRGPYLKR